MPVYVVSISAQKNNSQMVKTVLRMLAATNSDEARSQGLQIGQQELPASRGFFNYFVVTGEASRESLNRLTPSARRAGEIKNHPL